MLINYEPYVTVFLLVLKMKVVAKDTNPILLAFQADMIVFSYQLNYILKSYVCTRALRLLLLMKLRLIKEKHNQKSILF